MSIRCTPTPSLSIKNQHNSPQNLADFLEIDLGYLFSEKTNDWQADNKPVKQTYQAYIDSKPTSTTQQRDKIYLQSFGQFTHKEQKIIEITAEYLRLFYHLEVKILATQSLDTIPKTVQRINQHTLENQILSTYLLSSVLLPQLPDSAAVYIGFTPSDLYPSPTWNYVFGQANLRQRTGIWSIYRFGNPDLNEETFKLVLARTIKTASHEIGHIFSIRHCLDYQCAMARSNHLRDLDKHPVHFCPTCTAKVCTNLRIDLVEHYKGLKLFWQKNGFDEQALFCEKVHKIIKSNQKKYQNLQGILQSDSSQEEKNKKY
jgi:archaemetzincin